MKTYTRFSIIMILLVSIIGGSIFAGGIEEQVLPAIFSQPSVQNPTRSVDPISENIQRLELLYRLVQRDFLFDIDHQEVYESMAKGLFTGLKDKYSAYIISQEASDFSEETTGRYGGIGAYISKTYLEYRDFSKPETYMVNITSVFPGSPAEASGLRSGDLISHIDGKPVDDMDAREASRSLKGDPDTKVVLTIIRGSLTFEVTVIRKIVSVPTVSKTIIDADIGYVRITQFTTSTGEQIREALRNMLNTGISSLILDLRDNPGGIVDSALGVADMFLQKQQLIVHVNNKDHTKDRTYVASDQMLIPKSMPVMVLINKGSASSSEILAGALKDNQRATLIGTNTFGKGLIQLVSPFGDGYYTLTTSQYRTPLRNDIHEVGIAPDIEVKDVTVTAEEMDIYVEFVNSGVIADFIKTYPQYSEEHITLFMETIVGDDPPMNPQLYRNLLRREYIFAMPFDERPIVDPDYDPVLKRAIEELHTFRK